jgi:hypothetical protein
VCVRSRIDSGFFGVKRSFMKRAQIRRGRPQLGDLLEEVVVDVEEERQARREGVDVEPAASAAST